jgi:hypothetical protein
MKVAWNQYLQIYVTMSARYDKVQNFVRGGGYTENVIDDWLDEQNAEGG